MRTTVPDFVGLKLVFSFFFFFRCFLSFLSLPSFLALAFLYNTRDTRRVLGDVFRGNFVFPLRFHRDNFKVLSGVGKLQR